MTALIRRLCNHQALLARHARALYVSQAPMHKDVEDAIRWTAARSCEEAMAEREAIINALEKAAKGMRNRGDCKRWLAHADCDVKRLSRTVHGPMFEYLADRINFHDAECVQMFRNGGALPCVRPHERQPCIMWT